MPLPDGCLAHWRRFMAPAEADSLLVQLLDRVPWQQHRVRVFGREYPTPRLCAWYGDAKARYAYSGQALEPLPWLPSLAMLRSRLEAALGRPFNSVLVNLYRDGADGMGWHSDDEPSLGPEPVIASLSVGATRRLVLRHRRRADLAPIEVPLYGGDLWVMAGALQRHWRHAVPKTRRAVGPRINLTFRFVRPGAATGRTP
ncbi:MAG: alpha-ketoglutarate-dependent dioxygenase AlkB [Immundisolibacter sp.]